MGFIVFVVVIILAFKLFSAIKANKEASKFKEKVSQAYSGNAQVTRELGNEFYYSQVPKKFYGNALLMPREEKTARKYILYALAEAFDEDTSKLEYEIKHGDYNTIDSVNLAREFVAVCIEKYGDKGVDKVLDTVLAKNLKLD